MKRVFAGFASRQVWWDLLTYNTVPIWASHAHRLPGCHSAYMPVRISNLILFSLCPHITWDSFPRRKQVQDANQRRLQQLPLPRFAYNGVDGGHVKDPQQRQNLLSSLMVPAQLELRVGAQVMLVKNYDSLLVNGCVGIVIQFILPSHHGGLSVGKATKRPLLGPEKYPLVRFSLLGDKGAPFSKEVLVLSDTFKLELPVIGVQASRRQVWILRPHPPSTPNPTL